MIGTATTDILPAAAPSESQGVLFDLAEVEGFGALSHRERLFCEGITLGMSQRNAARAAGVKGDDAAVDVTASRLAKKPEVRRFLGQCWQKSGASIEETLRNAARIQARAMHDYEEATNRDARAAAMKEWRESAALIASIHGRLGVNVSGAIDHRHAHLHAATGTNPLEVVPPEALGFLANLRRSVLIDRIQDKPKAAATVAA